MITLPEPGKMLVGNVEHQIVFVGPSEEYPNRYYVMTYEDDLQPASQLDEKSVRLLPVYGADLRRQIELDINPHRFEQIEWEIHDAEPNIYCPIGEYKIETKPWAETGPRYRMAGVKHYPRKNAKGETVYRTTYVEGFYLPDAPRPKGDGIDREAFLLHFGLSAEEYRALCRVEIAPRVKRGVIPYPEIERFAQRVSGRADEVNAIISKKRRALRLAINAKAPSILPKYTRVGRVLRRIAAVLEGAEPATFASWQETGFVREGAVLLLDGQFADYKPMRAIKIAEHCGWNVSRQRITAAGLKAWGSWTGNRRLISNRPIARSPKELCDDGWKILETQQWPAAY